MQDFQPTKNFYRVRQTVFIDFARIRIIGQEMGRGRSSPRTTKIPVWGQRGGHQIHWTSISIGHQLRVHRQIVAQRFCPIKTV